MTLRKYKKCLMSFGLDRDLAEAERKNMARIRSVPYGQYLECSMETAMLLALHRTNIGCTSLRKYRQHIKLLIKNAVVV